MAVVRNSASLFLQYRMLILFQWNANFEDVILGSSGILSSVDW